MKILKVGTRVHIKDHDFLSDGFLHALLLSHLELEFELAEVKERLALIQEQNEYDIFDD